MDIVTGSNCCANNICHWYRLSEDGHLSRRFDIQFVVNSEHSIAAKSESRPYVIDWNRDGFDDLVLVLRKYLAYYENESQKRPNFRTEFQIFVNADSETRPALIRKGQAAKAKRPADYTDSSGTLGGPLRGVDVKLKLRAIDLGNDDAPNDLDPRHVIHRHYAFADFDNDGNFDILYCEVDRQHISGETKNDNTESQQKISSSVYWMRNLSSSGEPRFDSPVKICDIRDGWQVNSISVGQLDNDGMLDAVVSVHQRQANKGLVTELWLLKGE